MRISLCHFPNSCEISSNANLRSAAAATESSRSDGRVCRAAGLSVRHPASPIRNIKTPQDATIDTDVVLPRYRLVCNCGRTPSSLAVEMVQNYGETLIGFARGEQFNELHTAIVVRVNLFDIPKVKDGFRGCGGECRRDKDRQSGDISKTTHQHFPQSPAVESLGAKVG